MGYYFLLISSWLSLFLGPILVLYSMWIFSKRKSRKAKVLLVLGIILNAYALYFWIPEINRSQRAYDLRQEELEKAKSDAQER